MIYKTSTAWANGILLAVICATIIASGCAYCSRPYRGNKANETWESNNKTFKIRVTAYAEENGGGAYYVFQSTPVGSGSWGEIMTFRHDDPIPIPREQIRFLNDQIGYIFMGWMYAVTTDGGHTWAVWDATKDLPDWQCCNYKLIQDISLTSDGIGVMKLNPIPERRGEVPELQTKDYGRNWAIK